nr:PHD and RING finger domain-containing protein 1 isoform X2 [Danio rerio]|eukprot:XP_002666914.2 PHD and RING finger domain-containing protein 1 isoform X2 [Danio rerio]
MEEDDSQDELINRNVSHGKGKRPAMSIISDDEDNSEGEDESEEEETGSEGDDDDDEEQQEILDEEEDEDEESEDEDAGKVLEGAVGNISVDAMDLSSDEDSEKCPICLNSFHEQPVATPETCEHYFCLDCILEWSKNANSCPVDRIVFNNIILRKCHGGKIQKTIAVKKPVKPAEEQVEVDLDQTSCEICGGRDREDRLLLCDGCDAGYHMECLTPPLDAVPVEEWFCPECIANNRTSGSEQISEEESSSLPTTSHSRSRPTRAIARTQQSERVRASVNRHRITQARTAEQLAPRYMMQSTWLDETINAVVAGLNTAVYVRDLTPRSRPRRRRKTVKRRKSKSKSSSTSGGKPSRGVKRRKRKVRRSKLRRKLVVKKETNSRGRIARSLGIKKPESGSIIPSVYRPSEYSLGSMRAEIGAASLSVYGDPFDLDPFNDREDEIQVLTPSSVLDAKRRGLSRSALRSHQPVARPISASLSRQSVTIPQVGDVAEEAPVSDLLGSILSGQSLLLMDSSDVVINRDGSLKAAKSVSLSLQRNPTTGSGEMGNTPSSERLMCSYGEAGLSSSPLREPSLVQSSPGSSSTPQNPTSPHIQAPHLSRSQNYPHMQPRAPHRPPNLNLSRPENGHLSISGVRIEPFSRVSNGSFDSAPHDKDGIARQPPIRKDPPKPVWVDVSVLPRIPKIKRDSGSKSSGSSSSASSVPSGMSLAGNSGRKQAVDNRETGTSQQNRTLDVQKQTVDRTGASSSFSSSFTSTASSYSASSNSRPSSSSISFRINSSGNPWQTRRLLASGGALFGDDEESTKINNKSKRILLSSRKKKKDEKCEVYDPFSPTGSDSSDNEPEVEGLEDSAKNARSQMSVGVCEDICNRIKIEPVDMDPVREAGSEICVEVKTSTCKPCQQSPHHSDPMNIPVPSGASVSFTKCETMLEPTSCETLGSSFLKTQECTRSSCTDRNVKSELNFKIEAEPTPIRPQSKSLEESLSNLQQTSQHNLVCKELPSVSGVLNATNISVDREEKSHQSQSKDNKQSPSNCQSFHYKDCHKTKHSRSKEKRRSRSRSRDRRRSRSKSKERQRSRSKERKHVHSRDKRCSSSSSRERSTSGKKVICERSDNRGRERQRKRPKERRYSRSHSYSRSRSRERKSMSKCQGDSRSKRQKSELRSTSRERKKREDQLGKSLHREKSFQESIEPMSIELHEASVGANKTTESVKMERDARLCDREIMCIKPSIKELEPRSMNKSHGLGSSKHGDWSRILKDGADGISLDLLKSTEIKQEELWPISAVSEFKDIKKEDEPNFSLCRELGGVKEIKTEIETVGLISKESPDFNKSKLYSPDLEKGYAGFQDEIKMEEMIIGKEKIKTEQIWPDEDESPISDNPLVISLDIHDIDALDIKKEPTESYHLPPLEEDKKMSPLQLPILPIKQEPVISSDEDISVDYLIDNLDFIKKEMSETFMPDSAETTNPKFSIPESTAGNTQNSETVPAVLKSKSQGKRVTWNLEEPVEPQSEKLSKLAMFKLKLKQEGSRRSAATPQLSNQDKASKVTATLSSLQSPQGESSKPKSRKDVLQDPNEKEKYMKKLHMQERAIEEVKLAIKPFYQKRDITKEEYKEILRKAVQKVCHSKSGEINPVKVANLVTAYVEKYKHARRHRKEESGQSRHEDVPNDFQTSV